MSQNSCIELHNVSKSYKDLLALNNISFTIEKGDIFGYIGPNGAGKTTTIKILVGLIPNYKGDVYVNGITIPTFKDLHKIIGYHPQEVGFQEWRTVNHALTTFGRLSGVNKEKLEERIQDVLKFTELEDVRYKKIKHLSGGMIQKLRLCQALLHEPEILVLDEPLSGLDPSIRYQIKGLIKSLAKSGKTILFSSHILSDVQDIANVIGILHKGKILKIGSPNDLQSDFHVGNMIRIEVAKNTPLYQDLENIDDVEKVENLASNIQIVHLSSDINLNSIINQILKLLLENDCKIRNFSVVQPSLEEVYLKYVGGEVK
ncbi:MAG: ATP-binding cassette domain-containing protein [Candidatus Hodarchaeota archaeon]